MSDNLFRMLCDFQLIADTMALYGIDTQKLRTMAGLTPALLKVAQQKFRHGDEADLLKTLVGSHTNKMEETLEEGSRQGQTNSVALSKILDSMVKLLYEHIEIVFEFVKFDKLSTYSQWRTQGATGPWPPPPVHSK